MLAFLQKLNSKTWFPLAWTALTVILLCLPGSDIPGTGFFSVEGLDKVAHVILFGGIVLFWVFFLRQNPASQLPKQVFWAVLLTTILGIGLEFLQRYAIPNRSFDVWDICADFGGATASGFFHLLWNGADKK
ncbi:MAG TPA: VanZ family protein [Flavisolibacter sp.]|jgi:hypothetical protein|nr:VanZ family protein [Flavisolibacter sp.]